MAANATPLHIVVFPWLAFGHMIPYLELSKSLARRGHRVTYLTTPRNLRRLPPIPHHLSPLITFHPFPLPTTPGLPPTAEATTDLLPHQVYLLKTALDGLAGATAAFLRSISPPPDWIVVDVIQFWLPPIAADLGIPSALFCTFPAAVQVFLGPAAVLKTDGRAAAERLTAPPEWVQFDSKVAYRPHEARSMAGFYSDAASGVTDGYRLASVLEACCLVAIRSCVDFEPQWLSLLADIYEKPLVPVGLLPPAAEDNSGNSTTSTLFHWLSKQKPRSVLYVALGSEAALNIELIHELALGLELAGLPCIWALRKPANSDVDHILPIGFEDRTKAHGMIQVVMGWVPQLKVLAHEGVGGFLTHCGWNSLIEGLGAGHPLVLLPIFVDQGLNARVMAEKRVGVEVERREEDGFFTREAVARAVRLVMVEEEGDELRANAKQMSDVFSEKERHEQYMDDFVKYLRDHRVENV